MFIQCLAACVWQFLARLQSFARRFFAVLRLRVLRLHLLLLLCMVWGPVALAADNPDWVIDAQHTTNSNPSPSPGAASTLLKVAEQADVRDAVMAAYTAGSVQGLTPLQRNALAAYINPLVSTVYAMTFVDVGPQVKGVYLPRASQEAFKPQVHPMQAQWQGDWQRIRPLLLGLGLDGLPSIESLLGRLQETEKARSLGLAVTQVDKALQRLKPNATVRAEQLMFRLNALYIVLEGQVAPALNVNLDFSGRKSEQEEVELEQVPGVEEEQIVYDPVVRPKQTKRSKSNTTPKSTPKSTPNTTSKTKAKKT